MVVQWVIYHFMAIEDNGEIYSVTYELLKKLVIVDIARDKIEIYHLDYIGDE